MLGASPAECARKTPSNSRMASFEEATEDG